MKNFRTYSILAALILIGALIGLYLAKPGKRDSSSTPDKEGGKELAFFDYPKTDADQSSNDVKLPDFPPGAIPGEYVIHFPDRKSYLEYIAALRAAGEAPLGQIDELRAVRITDDSLLAVDFSRYGAKASYTYTVKRPPPPVEIDPAALAGLRAYGNSARSIVGGELHGDGSGVVVAILDSGIEAHPQFDDVYIVNIDLVGGKASESAAAHGTSVASIIAGTEGIAPNSELLVVRVLDDEGKGNSYQVAEGIVQAVDLGVKVINLSLGVYEDSYLLRQAVDYAAENGVIMVAAAGNDGYNRLPYPAAYDQVLSVTAYDAAGRQAVFPNQSSRIDFAAPGLGILTAADEEGTELFSGTSAAAPFVTGTLASLMSGEKPMSPKEAVSVLRRYLNDSGAPGTDPVYGAGALDWDRLRERSTPGILDVALADIHLSPDALPGTNMPISVTVQNRGTKWFNTATLEVMVDDNEPVSFSIGTLGPGQTTTRKVYVQIPSQDSKEALSLAARVLPEDLNEDVRLSNNLKGMQFRPR